MSVKTIFFASTIYIFLPLFLVPSTFSQPWIVDSSCPDNEQAIFHECALQAIKVFDPPRLDNGDPDLRGVWRRTVAAHESIEAHPKTLDDQETSSSVVFPESGFVPIQPWAEAQRKYNRIAYVHHNAICRLDGVPLSMYMTGLYQLSQTFQNILIQGEEAHAFRMIPFSDSHTLGEEIKLWNGDSIGSWDQNTFVVDTTNQNARAWLDQRGRFFTDEAHVEERFTLVDANTLHYQATVTDENVFTQPFTIAIAFRRNASDFEIWEEACYEDNAISREGFFNVGYKVYPGISGDEARRLRDAWDLYEESR
ncbi:MAG: hypothetical protein CBC38_06180 [Gammaproteobacteria bacterium TMED78]|nr:MAG: hypothetical protein CBC38_06180 [Gammaproteobacteria bacterium TMED78]